MDDATVPPVIDEENREYSIVNPYVHTLKNKRASSNLILLGPRRSGKTSILASFAHKSQVKEAVVAYAALGRMSTSPENFAQEFLGNICASFLGSKSIKDISDLKKHSSSLSPSAKDIIQKIDNELQKIKPDQKALVQWAFEFPQKLAEETGKKIILILDDFENLLELNNFSQIKNILSLISFKQKNVQYIASSCFSTEFKKLKNFEAVEIKGLDRKQKGLGSRQPHFAALIYSTSGD